MSGDPEAEWMDEDVLRQVVLHQIDGHDECEPDFCEVQRVRLGVGSADRLDEGRLFRVLWKTNAYWKWANDTQPSQEQRFRDWAANIAREYARLAPPVPDPDPDLAYAPDGSVVGRVIGWAGGVPVIE